MKVNAVISKASTPFSNLSLTHYCRRNACWILAAEDPFCTQKSNYSAHCTIGRGNDCGDFVEELEI